MGKHPFKILCIDGGGIKVFFHHIIIIAVTIFAVVTAIVFLKNLELAHSLFQLL